MAVTWGKDAERASARSSSADRAARAVVAALAVMRVIAIVLAAWFIAAVAQIVWEESR